MKKLNKSGALRARTRAFFCALTLALLCFTTPAKAQIWGTEPSSAIGGVDFSTGVASSAVTVTATPDPDDATKQRVVIFKQGAENNSQIPKIWVTLIVDAAVTINSFEDIPVGVYYVSNSKAVGTALASQGLTANTSSGAIIGCGGLRYYTSNGNLYWFHAVESANNIVTIGEDFSADHHKLMYAMFTDFRHTTNYTVNMAVCYSGTSRDYVYLQSDPTVCGDGSVAYSQTRANRRKFMNDVSVTATPGEGKTFHHWEDGDGNNLGTDNPINFISWGPESIKAVFSDCGELAPATPTYEVTATVSPAGAGTVTGDGTYDEGENVTLTATPTNRRYVFSHWTDGGSSAGTDGNNVYAINSIAADHNSVVAVFTEVPVTLADNEESSYYTTTLSTFTGSMDFQLMRTFYAGMWNTVCFPFALSASQIANSDMSGATFYTLTSVTGDAAEGLDFNVSEVTSLSARTPYLVQVNGANITNPVLEGVTLAASAFTNSTSGTNVGDTKFFGTVHPTDLEIGENSGFLFLGQNNNLYWPNVANDIRAFRAYFYSGSSEVQSVHPRARIVVRGETPTDVEERISDGNGSAPRKYLHNGVLVIEKNGIRYNAVGQVIE